MSFLGPPFNLTHNSRLGCRLCVAFFDSIKKTWLLCPHARFTCAMVLVTSIHIYLILPCCNVSFFCLHLCPGSYAPRRQGSSIIFPLTFALVSEGCHNKVPSTGGLKQQEIVLSRFWRPEVKNQGVGQGRAPSGPPMVSLCFIQLLGAWLVAAKLQCCLHLRMAVCPCVSACMSLLL